MLRETLNIKLNLLILQFFNFRVCCQVIETNVIVHLFTGSFDFTGEFVEFSGSVTSVASRWSWHDQ